MTDHDYQRFEVIRPDYLADDYWTSINAELIRMNRSLEAGDEVDALGNVKCLVEAVGKVALDIAGTPAASNASFSSVVSGAHDLLRGQAGRELAHGTPFANMANNASKMALQLGDIRNAFGGGHGKARQPHVRAEMVDLVLDGSLTWVRWAVRRLGLFATGRPAELIRDLIVEQQSFYKFDLAERLRAAGLATLEERHQRSLGVAVGQRAATGTFNVYLEGVQPVETSADLDMWPAPYRLGVVQGLLQDADEQPTVTSLNIVRSMAVLVPVDAHSSEVEALVDQILATYTPPSEISTLTENLRELQRLAGKAGPNQAAMTRLLDGLRQRML